MELELITKKYKDIKCPECMFGKLSYNKKRKTWICCKGFLCCLREYKEKLNGTQSD